MALLDNVKRIIKEDFPEKDRELIGRLGYVLNTFMEQVVDAFDGKINFNNLSQESLTFKISVDSAGLPTKNSKLRYTLTDTVLGVQCIRARNLASTSQYPTSAPFVSFTTTTEGGNNILNIQHISGLQANTEYEITIILIS